MYGVFTFLALALALHGAAALACRPLIYRKIPLNDHLLSCDSFSALELPSQSDLRGKTVARLTFDVKSQAVEDGSIHAWTGRLALGDREPSFDFYRIGEPVCNGQAAFGRQLLGAGTMTDWSHGLRAEFMAYTTSGCQAGTVILRNVALELWNEDPECPGTSIAESTTAGGSVLPVVTFDIKIRPILSVSLRTNGTSSLTLLSQVATGSQPHAPNNTCGNKAETLSAFLYRDSNDSIVGERQMQLIPPSGGQTHMQLTPSAELPNEPAGMHSFSVRAAVNQVVNNGYLYSGDSASGAAFLFLIAH